MGILDEVLDEELADRETDLRSSLYSAADANPDEEAFFSSLSQRTGLPVEALRNDKGAEGKRLQTVQQADSLLTQAPQTAAWMAKNENARHGHDDIDNLAATEDLFIKRGAVSTLGMASEGDKALRQDYTRGRTVTGTAKDFGITLTKAAIGLPQSILGLIDMPTFGHVGKALQSIGYNPKEVQDFLSENYSLAQQDANKEVYGAEGIMETIGAAVRNPSVTLNTIVESAPQMLGGAAAARGILGVGAKTAAVGPNLPGWLSRIAGDFAPVIASATGEGIMQAGSATEQFRGDSADGLVSGKQVFSAAASGGGTALFSILGGKAAQVLKIDDIDVLLTGSSSIATTKGAGRRFLEGAFSEGILEELPQSVQEQMWTNYGNDKPLMEGVEQAAVLGAFAGIAMGGAIQLKNRKDTLDGAQANKDFMMALGGLTQESKLYQRMPAKHKELIEKMRNGSDVENVFFEASEWTTFFQSQNVDPAQVAEELGAGEEYRQAMALGTEMVMPIEAYIEKLAGSPHYEGLANILKLHQDAKSYNEAVKFEGEMNSQLDSLLNEDEGEAETPAKKVYNDIYQGLAAVGRNETNARGEALLESSRVIKSAADLGRDAWEIWQENPIKFKRETFDPQNPNILYQSAPGASVRVGKMTNGKWGAFDREAGDLLESFDTEEEARNYTPDGKMSSNADGLPTGEIEIFRGEYSGNKGGGYYTPDREFARQFTQSGQDKEITRAFIDASKIYAPETLPAATSETEFDGALKGAKEKGYGAVWFSEGKGEPPSIYVMDKKLLAKKRTKYDQRMNDDKRASITFLPTHRLIELFKGADASSNIHEFSHSWLEELKRDGQAGVNEQIKKDWEITRKMFASAAADLHRNAKGYAQAALAKELAKGDEAILSVLKKLRSDIAYLDTLTTEAVSAEYETWTLSSDWLWMAAHERFADTGVTYVMEGVAPSVELIPVFQRFKAQLTLLFQRAKIALLPMNDEIRGVFDRLLASKEQTAEARRQQGFVPLILTAESAGMTERGFAAYRKAMEKAHLAAEDALQQKLMREMAREDLVWWKEAEAKTKEEVTKEAQQEPIYDAFQVLSTGKTFAGDDAPEGFKISRAELVKIKGETFTFNLPPWFRKGISKKGGMHPDEVAEVFGFSSGDDMIQQMVNALPFRQFVDAETSRRMLRDHGDMMTDGRLPEEAMQAVHTDMQAEVLHAELKALKAAERQSRPAVKAALQDAKAEARAVRDEAAASLPPLDAFRTWAAQAIGNMPVGKLRPSSYLRAERKAANAAQELYQKQKFAEAYEEKQKQIANMFLYREAVKAQEDAAKAYKFASKLQASAAQERIGKAGEDYLEQINGLLETYEFKKITVGERNKRLTLREWAAQQEEMGLESSIDPRILDGAMRKNYQELTVDELRAVHDALKNINHLAIESNKIRVGAEELELQDALDQLTDAAESAYNRKKVPSKNAQTPLQSFSAKLKSFDASLIKVEQVVEWLDGWKAGPWAKMIFQPLVTAQNAENDLSVTFTAMLNAIFNDYFTANDYSVMDKLAAKGKALKDEQGLDDTLDKVMRAGNRMQEKVHISSLNMPMTREEIISVGLNVGNASNLDKLLRGKGWRPDQLEEILSHITESDARFIQSTWDMINELWPAMAALQKRMSGVAPPKIEASPVTLGGIELPGGYFPVIYDQTESAAGQKQADANAEKMFGDNYVRATTKHGSTNERTGAAYPILLSLTTIPSHMAGVIHDITHREAITTINRLLSNQQTMDAMRETIGLEYHRLMTLWLANVANDRNVDREGTEQFKNFLNALRVNTSIVGMGFRFSTMITQLAGYSQSLEMVKGRYLAQGLKEFTADHEGAVAWVMEKSGEIRHRRNNLDRDLRDGVRKLMGQSGVVPWIQAQAFAGIGLMDSFVSIPTWIGAYRQAEAAGASEAESINAADKAVRLSQGSGGAKDLAAVQRSGTVMKYLTMFYSYFSMLYSRLRNMGRLKAQNEIGWFGVAYKSVLMVAIPAILTDLMTGRGPDDDEDELAWAARKVAMYPLGTIPILRDMVNAMGSGRDYSPSPMVRAADMVVSLPKQIESVREDRKAVADLLFDNADIVGYTFGLPTGQPKTTFRYIWDVMNDEAQPEDTQDVLKGLLFTRKKGDQK